MEMFFAVPVFNQCLSIKIHQIILSIIVNQGLTETNSNSNCLTQKRRFQLGTFFGGWIFWCQKLAKIRVMLGEGVLFLGFIVGGIPQIYG